ILFSYIASSPFILQEMYGLTPAQFSYCFACISLGLTGSTQLAGRLSGRFGDQRLLNAGLVVCLLSSLTVLGVTICRTASVIILLIPLFIAVSCVGIVTITTFSLAIRQQSGMAGSAAGLIGVLSFMAGGIAAPLVGLCGSQTAIPLGVMLVLASLASILACGFRKQD
ncbi:MAG: MFS transporter, partial [Verrucomicrobia bacterium]|nr:MFS transporter [Verrucomicrobiota bacterium]